MAESISGKIVRNTVYNVFGYAGGALITLALTPYLVGSLGEQAYGVLVVVGILGGYFGLLDFGINTSFIKYIAGYSANNDVEGVSRVVSTGLAFYLVFSAAAAAAGFACAGWLVSLMRIPDSLFYDAVFSLKAGFLIFAVTNIFSPFGSLQRGLQRMDVSNKLSLAAAVFNACVAVAAVETGGGLKGVIAAYLLTAVLRGLADTAAAFRICPGLRARLSYADRNTFSDLFVFGYKLQVAKISGMVSAHFDKLLIAAFLSAGMVTAYQVGSMVAVYAVSAVLLLTTALMPAFSEALSQGDNEKVLRGYSAGTRYIALVAAPFFSFLIFSAPQLMLAWMGEGHSQSALALRILGAGWLLNTILGAVGGAFVQAMDRPGIQMRAALLNIVMNPLLSFGLLKLYGFPGALAGTSFSISAAAFYFTWELHREFSIPLGSFLYSAVLTPVLLSAFCGAAAFFAAGQLEGGAGLAAHFAVFCLLYLALMLRLKPLAAEDADRVFGASGRFRSLAGNFCSGRPA